MTRRFHDCSVVLVRREARNCASVRGGWDRQHTYSPIIFHTSIGSEGHRGGVIPSPILAVYMVVEGRCFRVIALQEDDGSWETRREEVDASSELGSAKPELYICTKGAP